MLPAVHDVQVKYGSKVTDCNVISTLFISSDQCRITVVKNGPLVALVQALLTSVI